MWHTPYPFLNSPDRPEFGPPELVVVLVISGLTLLLLLYGLARMWDGGSRLRPRGYYRKQEVSRVQRHKSLWNDWVTGNEGARSKHGTAQQVADRQPRGWAKPL